MTNSSFRSFLVPFLVGSMVACASAEPSAEQGGTDEDLTSAADASYPSSTELITALKKANRAALLPSKVALVTNTEATDHNIVRFDVKVAGDDRLQPDAQSIFATNWSMLKTRGFRIVGKTVSYDGCNFSGTGDYLERLSGSPTFLSGNMARGNQAIGQQIYSAADISRAKAVEASISHKLVLTAEHLAVYLGKQGGAWKVIGIDEAAYSDYHCDAE